MKLFLGFYNDSWGYGGYQEHYCAIVANTEDEALGLALMQYPDSTRLKWSFDEVPMDKVGCHHLTSRGT